jgi:hypothetical protein
MVWKYINISNPGTSIKFGSNDMDKISQLFSGVDVDDVTIIADVILSKLKSESFVDFKAIAEPSSPASGYVRMFIDTTDGRIKIKKSDGSVVVVD